ncbi:MAG: FadR/GntR family transcriptional regulator [Solirubrobacteraceae bacterium]
MATSIPRPSSAEDAPLFFAVPREERLPDKVAARIRETILEQQLRPGDRLPSERRLGEQFEVSRTVIREAVRSLAAMGLVESAGRGLRVAAVDSQTVTDSMRLFLHGRPTSYEKVDEVRSMIEIEVAGLAAERAGEADIERLRQLCEEQAASEEQPEAAAEHDVEFHRALAEATHNELYLIMLDSMRELLLEARRATMGVPGRIEKGARAHRGILSRVAAGDAEGAREAMRHHLRDSRRAWNRLQRD